MKKLLYLSFLFLTVFAFGQERTVFGKVISKEDGLPLSFVTIMIENTNKTTQTDLDGNYSIIANPNDILVFSFVGIETQRVKADKEEINVQIEVSGNGREVVYITYKPKKLTTKNIKNVFKEEAKNNRFIVFISEFTIYSNFSEEELEFQKKYNLIYSSTTNYDVKSKYLKKFNKLTFKHLTKKYNKEWQNEIRKDAIGLDDFLR